MSGDCIAIDPALLLDGLAGLIVFLMIYAGWLYLAAALDNAPEEKEEKKDE